MGKFDERLSSEAALLNQYLNQYRRCIGRKRSLEHRREEILREFENPLSGTSFSSIPYGSGDGLGCAALSFRLDEIDTRIAEQVAISAKALTSIMDVIEFLPEDSLDRAIIEHRYIDRYGWEKICQIVHLSRTPATRCWRRGLYRLLEFKKVQKILSEYEEAEEKERL